MPDLIYLLAVLACPVGMGLMMLMMMRGTRGHHGNQDNRGSGADGDEVAQLRAEVERLRVQRSDDSNPVDQAPTAP